MKITGNDLLDKNACAAGVAFYLHNNLQDVDWGAVKKIELTARAHQEYAKWLCGKFGLTMSVGTADGRETSYENGNRTHYRDSDGYEEWREYDADGHETHYRNSDGYEWWRKYDADGNQTHFRNSDGFEEWREYDADGNQTHSRDSNGYERWREYDADGKETHCRDSNGYERWREYDADGKETHYRDSNGYEWWREYNGEILISATVKRCEPETLDNSVLEQLGI